MSDCFSMPKNAKMCNTTLDGCFWKFQLTKTASWSRVTSRWTDRLRKWRLVGYCHRTINPISPWPCAYLIHFKQLWLTHIWDFSQIPFQCFHLATRFKFKPGMSSSIRPCCLSWDYRGGPSQGKCTGWKPSVRQDSLRERHDRTCAVIGATDRMS